MVEVNTISIFFGGTNAPMIMPTPAADNAHRTNPGDRPDIAQFSTVIDELLLVIGR